MTSCANANVLCSHFCAAVRNSAMFIYAGQIRCDVQSYDNMIFEDPGSFLLTVVSPPTVKLNATSLGVRVGLQYAISCQLIAKLQSTVQFEWYMNRKLISRK